MIDLKTIDEHIAKAKSDLDFWEKAKALLLDPRISEITERVQSSEVIYPRQIAIESNVPIPTGYGDLKRTVFATLPVYGGVGMTTSEIVDKMKSNGFVFASQTPIVAVNEALSSLGDQVKEVGKRGLSKLWTKA